MQVQKEVITFMKMRVVIGTLFHITEQRKYLSRSGERSKRIWGFNLMSNDI